MKELIQLLREQRLLPQIRARDMIREQDEEETIFQGPSGEDLEARKTDEERRAEAAEKEREARWKAEKAAARAQSRVDFTRLHAIATALGFTPKVDRLPSDASKAYLAASRPDKGEIYFVVDYNRVRVSGHYADNGFTNEEAPGNIYISFTKTDDQIIREIQRRLIPRLDAAIPVAKTRIDQDNAFKTARTEVLNVASKILKEKPYQFSQDPGTEIRAYQSDKDVESINVKVNYTGTDAYLELRIKAGVLPQLLTFLKGLG